MLVDRARQRLLGELLARGVGGQRQVGVGGHRMTEQAEEVDLARGRVEQVGAAHDVGHPRFGVVHHHRELIGEEAVGALDHVVAGVGGEVDLLLALHRVAKAHHALGAHPPGAAGPSRRQAVAAGAGIAARAVARERLAGELAPGARTGIGEAGRAQALERGRIGFAAFALAHDRAVPFEAEAFQRGEDACGGAGHRARGVHVLDAQQPASAVRARIQEAAHGGDQRAEVQRAAGRGGEAADVGVCAGAGEETRIGVGGRDGRLHGGDPIDRADACAIRACHMRGYRPVRPNLAPRDAARARP